MTALARAADAAFDVLCAAHTFVVIDVETCPSPEGERIVSIAAATSRRGRVRSIWSTTIDPGVPITNSWIHGLTDTDVAGAPSFGDVLDSLNQLIAAPDTIVVCHNARFDIGLLHLECLRLDDGRVLNDAPVLDTMRLPDAVGHVMPSRSRTLAALCASLNVTNTAPHTAVADATATAEVLHALLRVAAANKTTDLDTVLDAASSRSTHTIAAADPANISRRQPADQLPAEHLETHTGPLSDEPSKTELDAWAANALECATLRCHLLEDKALLATPHAAELHARLTKHLLAHASTFEPGQGATLLSALNALAPAALGGRYSQKPYRWWLKHHGTVKALARCDTDTHECPDCRNDRPCPIDIAHQPLVTTAVYSDQITLDPTRIKHMSAANRKSFMSRWTDAGLHDMAGYAAWLAADWLASAGKLSGAAVVVDYAMELEAFDPRIIRIYAERLTLQQRDAEAEAVVRKHLAHRTTDEGWQELAEWWNRHLARQRQRFTPPNPKPGTSSRVARPSGRVRPRRFSA
ncbi:3'-5' exonuclease [Acidimicrobiia bacterium EGI L10123]|uniref:3'-5' exonuclease n=1 Tax=Salinilacustrithrix flava TaxID=2957203 RepID=UPI003D7C2A30|nr:3'-5' exonuclease [Acidimicrobiia bacterium EGI L10123]